MERARAQAALLALKETILEFVTSNPGVTNSEVSRALGLESDFQGNQKNYLAWSILGMLVNEKLVRTEKPGTKRFFYAEDK